MKGSQPTKACGALVVDARGPRVFPRGLASGFQKFVGLELELREASELRSPIVMDARVPQRDGFRFFYVLPLAPDRVLVEDTYFSDTEVLDRPRLRAEIARYVERLGLCVRRVAREEAGILPLPTRPMVPGCSEPGLVRAGYQGGWFHPTTGYSFPLGVRLAQEIAAGAESDLAARLNALTRQRADQQLFCTRLNRMLFDAFEPEQRFHVLERFYALPAPVVRRFYALSLTRADRVRILCGRPPTGFRISRLWSRRSHERTFDPTAEEAR
jgi:lycopene beta-cyclase